MAKTDVAIFILTMLTMLFTIMLATVGETRPDAYVSVSILIYFVYTAVDPTIRRYSKLKLLDIALVTMFMMIVIVRVLEVLEII